MTSQTDQGWIYVTADGRELIIEALNDKIAILKALFTNNSVVMAKVREMELIQAQLSCLDREQ